MLSKTNTPRVSEIYNSVAPTRNKLQSEDMFLCSSKFWTFDTYWKFKKQYPTLNITQEVSKQVFSSLKTLHIIPTYFIMFHNIGFLCVSRILPPLHDKHGICRWADLNICSSMTPYLKKQRLLPWFYTLGIYFKVINQF